MHHRSTKPPERLAATLCRYRRQTVVESLAVYRLATVATVRRIFSLWTLCLCAVFVNANDSPAADWPQWRGPNQDGVSSETSWSSDWGDDGPTRLWDFQPGSGNSSVSVVGNRVYTIGSSGESEETDTVYCLDADAGSVVWKHEYARHERLEKTATRRAGTNTTPTVTGGKVYSCSGDAQLFCFDAASGDIVWSRELMKELDVRHPQYDHNSSPVIVGDLVIVLARLPDASIIAFDKGTGKEAWRAFHQTRRGGLGGFWSTPVHAEVDGKSCLVYLPGLSVVGLDPATGMAQWKYDFTKEGIEQADRGAVAASPVVLENRVFFPFHPDHGRGFSGCIEIENGNTELKWKSMRLAHWWHSPVVWEGCVIALDQGPAAQGQKSGALYCYEMTTGDLKWSTYEIGDTSRDTLTKGAKMMIAGDRLILHNDYGAVLVAQLTDKGPEPLATLKPFQRRGKNWTVPVLANGRLYCRGGRANDLACFDLSPERK